MESDRPAISVYSLPPCGAGQSHVEILDSNRACESAAGFQSCAHDPISIPMLRPFAENWPHAIALHKGGGSTPRLPLELLVGAACFRTWASPTLDSLDGDELAADLLADEHGDLRMTLARAFFHFRCDGSRHHMKGTGRDLPRAQSTRHGLDTRRVSNAERRHVASADFAACFGSQGAQHACRNFAPAPANPRRGLRQKSPLQQKRPTSLVAGAALGGELGGGDLARQRAQRSE